MTDEPLATEPERGPPVRTHLLIGGLAFLGGIALTAGAYQFATRDQPAPLASPTPSIAAPAPAPADPALPPGTDIATLNAREAELAGKLDRLELRLRDVDGSARTASTYASQAERLMIAFSVRRAIERGLPLGPLEAQLRQRFGERHGDAVAAILRAAAEPVTLEDLRLALDTIAPRLTIGPDDSMWMRVRRLLGDLVVLRQAESPSPRPVDRLRRARRTLDEGEVDAALAEVAHMPGVTSAESWVAAARRYMAARQALIEIETAAIAVPPQPPMAVLTASPIKN